MSLRRGRALNRANSRRHSRRKRKIATKIYGNEWYGNLHQYSKNKIHCSCWMCSFHGPSYSDMKKGEKIKYSIDSYEKNEDTGWGDNE